MSFVALLYDHLYWSRLSFEAITWAFVVGGILGVLGASLLEPLVLPRSWARATRWACGGLLVAAIEEGSKLVAVMFVARRMSHTGALDGLLLGTAVGMGFAAQLRGTPTAGPRLPMIAQDGRRSPGRPRSSWPGLPRRRGMRAHRAHTQPFGSAP